MDNSANIFQNSDFSQSEDIVFIIENSPAFYINDIEPNRFERFIGLMESFIENRIKLDYRDRYFLIIFNREILTPMEDFDTFSHRLIEQIKEGFDKTESVGMESSKEWIENFIKSLQKGIQKCISSFKRIRNKTLRIIIIINQLPQLLTSYNEQIKTIIKRTAQRLDIIIDVLFVQGEKKVLVFDYENPYKFISEMTGGTYFTIRNLFQFREAFDKIAKKKEILKKTYLGEREYAEEKQFLEIIASDLERITEMLNEADLKCNICFKIECSHVSSGEISDIYEHIRRCPNCKKILHLCCAGKWAEQQNSKTDFIGFPNVFRCPYCFFLCKVPREFVNFDTILNQLRNRWLKKKEKEELKRRQEEEKEREIQQFMTELERKQKEKERIVNWLLEKIPHKSKRECERIADEIVRIENEEEKISFINYLKFKEEINDDSMPF
ncbi:MAG: hypothetical protein ACTSQP_06230 [Promethearchaeota archaeon]